MNNSVTMKGNASNKVKTILATALLLLLTVTLAVNVSATTEGKSGTETADALVNSASGQMQVSMAHPLGWLIALILKNPRIYPTSEATAVVKILMPVILAALTPIWQMLIILNGIYFIWGARDPASRNAAKQRMIHLTIGMILCGLSAPIFQMILEVEHALAVQVLAAGGISTAELVGAYLAGTLIAVLVVVILVKLAIVSFGTLICPIIMILAMPFIALGLRYIVVLVFALLFPIMIFLYFFDLTKQMGSKLFRTAMLWVSVPVVQAMFIVVMLEGVKAAERFHLMGGFIALACFVLIGVVPFMMEGMMGAIGGALIHSGYTTSNPRLVMIGSLFSGQGPATGTTFAWYANMGMQEPAGGRYTEQEKARQMGRGESGGRGLHAIPVPSGAERREAMADERRGLEKQIASKRAQRASATGATADRLDREINKLTEDKRLTAVAPISDGQRKLAEEAKSYDQLKSVLDRQQMYRFMKEQEYARKHGLPVKGPDLSAHKGAIMRARLTAPFAPKEVLAPAGAFLAGLITQIMPESGVGKSLDELCKKMMPHMEYKTDSKGNKVAVMKTGWETWRDVGKSAVKSKYALFAAGVSLLSVTGLPVLLGAAGVGLTIAAVGGAIGLDKDREERIKKLDSETPGKLKRIRELSKKKMSGAVLDVKEKEDIRELEIEFGMPLEKVLQKHETGKLATSRGLENLQREASSPGGITRKDDKDRMTELRDAFNIDPAKSDKQTLGQILDEHVTPERSRLQKEAHRDLNKPEGVERLMNMNDPRIKNLTTPLTDEEKERKKELDDKIDKKKPLTAAEEKEHKVLTDRDERHRLGAIFGVDPSDPTKNVAAAVARDSPELKQKLEDYQRDLLPEKTRAIVAATPTTDLHENLTEKAASVTGAERKALREEETLLKYARDQNKRSQLRWALKDYPELTQAERDKLNKKYEGDMKALGIKPSDQDALKQLNDKVHGVDGLGLDAREDERAYNRWYTLNSKEQRGKPLTDAERMEKMDLDSHLTMEETRKRIDLEQSVEFRNADIMEGQKAKEELTYSKYAAYGTERQKLNQDVTDYAKATPARQTAARDGLINKYGQDMADLGIITDQQLQDHRTPGKPKISEEELGANLNKLKDKVNGSRQVQAVKKHDAIDKILGP